MVKGIQHVDDAREAARRGIDGIVVSNHGGRQVDGAIASLDALAPIAEAVGGELAVLFDSGIRSGADVLKALALGADAVCLGRPYVWGLALGGPGRASETVLKMVLAELDLTMALCGYTSPDQLGPDALRCAGRPGASIFGKSGGTRSTLWPPGREPSSASSRESSPSAASSCSLVRGR